MSGRAARRARNSKGPFDAKYESEVYVQPSPRAYYTLANAAWQRGYCSRYWAKRREVMNISVVHEDGTENEFDIELCCVECAAKSYKWNDAQFMKIWNNVQANTAIQVPDHIDSETKFIEFVKTT